MARGLAQQHLLRWLREAGYNDSTLYSYRHPPCDMANDLAQGASSGRPVIIIGYSQGGFHAVKVARELEKRRIPLTLLVTIAAGGLGRLHPAQWGVNPRPVPSNVLKCLNFFAEGDMLGYDLLSSSNLAIPAWPEQPVENIRFPAREGISHKGLVTCYPESRVHASIKTHLLDRLSRELGALTTSC